MSSRALRKAQREREEQERAQKLEAEEQEESEEENNVATPAVRKSAFALLGEEEEEEEEDGEDGEVSIRDSHVSDQSTTTTHEVSNSKKKKKKKKKPKATNTIPPPSQDEELDEIDKALKQLSTNGNSSLSGSTHAGIDASTEETGQLLAIDTNHLHSQNEMRHLFGRTALENQDDDAPAPEAANVGGNRRQQRRVQQLGLAEALRRQPGQGGRSSGLTAAALRRNIFIQGKEEWPVAPGGGLVMEIEEKRADGTILYRFTHNRFYQDVQAQFQMAVESMDPQRLVTLLQHNPFHISTLLQVSEIAKQEGDHATSGDLLSRALFSFGRSVHSTFAKTLAAGKARLDFRRMENREFWLASWRYMQNLSRRALWRTVYEWSRLLLSLAPEDDPYGMLWVWDQYALRAREDLDFLNTARSSVFKERVKTLPNVQISQGLAEYRAGNKGKGQQALFSAFGRFPWVVARLMHELDIQPPPGIWGKEPRTDKEKLDCELYATRAKDIWKTPENSALLLEIASALPPDTPPAKIDDTPIEENLARHVLLSDTPALIALIPRRYTTALQSSSDPLPPQD
ncbi:transcriptional repressor TCF25-domain-containing protein, partial [Neohortaea acidophila]